MPIDQRFKLQGPGLKRDIRPWTVKTAAWLKSPFNYQLIMGMLALFLIDPPLPNKPDMSFLWAWIDLIILFMYFYSKWFFKQLTELPFKLPLYAGKMKDKNNPTPGKSGPGKAEGILFLGNIRDGSTKDDELWLTNSDARTHILFLGTTGAGKTEGLKSLVTNSLTWGSGFVYVDGKAQNTLWGDVYSLARRFGRDDDVLVLNYMTGNSDGGSRSNSLNPFSIGSASYLVQMMVGLMDDAGDENGMWKGRAISLLGALMPALTWKRDNQGMMMDVGVIRDHLTMQQIIKMSRDTILPDRIIRGLQSYLDTSPGYVDSAFDDDGNERPQSPDQPMVDLSQTRQQHGYLTMQFTRSLSSLADEYGYIFKQQLADIDMVDVVLNRRILVVLIPALEKSPDEAANLGKIVVAALKGMMGSTLGADLEGEQAMIIDNNPTRSNSPFMTVFDEVGYYTSPGMGVMAAQARSLGFCLIFAGQDLPALQKRVKEEAMSITGNCNLKVFGKLEDPTETKDFFEKTVSSAMVSEVSGFSAVQGVGGRSFNEGDNISFQARKEAGYDDLRRQREGQVHFLWADKVVAANMFHASPPRVESVRVQRFLSVSPRNWAVEARDKAVGEVVEHLRDPNWTAASGAASPPAAQEIVWMAEGFDKARAAKQAGSVSGAVAVANIQDGLKRRTVEAVSSPNLANPADQNYWPFGAAGAGGALPPPVMGGAMPMGASAAPNPNTPSWMTGAGGAIAAPTSTTPQGMAPPPWAGSLPQAGIQPAAGAAPPPFMTAPPVPSQPQGMAPPPWAGGAAVPAAPQAPQPFGWSSVMGAAAGGQMAYAPPVAAPPSWMTPPPAGSVPPYGAPQDPMMSQTTPPPFMAQPSAPLPPQQQAQGQYQQPPYGAVPQPQTTAYPAPPPPWAGANAAVVAPPSFMAPPAVPQQQTAAYAAPPFMAPPTVPPQQTYAPQPMQPPVAAPPSFMQPAAPLQQDAGIDDTAWAPATAPESTPDVDAILRSAAGNLSDEMFGNGDDDETDEDRRNRGAE